MSNNVIKFPKLGKLRPPEVIKPPKAVNTLTPAPGRGVLAAIVKGVWVATVLVWPILKWVVSLDVVFQMMRMAYHWHTPGIHAGWTFAMHFALLTALTYFVSIYKPKGT